MTAPYYTDDSVTLHLGNCLKVLASMPDGSVDCCVTSPPYFGLRDYGEDEQHGAEQTPAEYVETMRAVFAQVRRVLADDGTFWLNLGDSYYSGRGASTGVDVKNPARRGFVRAVDKGGASWASPKNLLGIPWRVAFALQDDGWILRNEIIWSKPNAMPESVTDRLSNRHEHLFMFSKSRRYWFDLDPIREDVVTTSAAALSWARDSKEADVPGQTMRQHRVNRGAGKADGTNTSPTGTRHDKANNPLGRNAGDVWSIPTQPFPDAHFAVMAPELARRAVVAGCKPGGTVLDPYSGVGTTGMVAAKNGRRYVGIELNADTLDLSLRTRLAQGALDFGEGA